MTQPGLTGPEGQWYESTWISPEEAEATMAIQAVFEALESGQADHLFPDPFFKRDGDRPPLTDEDVDRLIAALDEEYDVEMQNHPGHHLTRSGATAQTDLHRLPPAARRHLAEVLDAIYAKHENIDQSAPPRTPPGPAPTYSGGYC